MVETDNCKWVHNKVILTPCFTIDASPNVSGFDQIQGLREQNMQLKSKMTKLNLALDKAMQDN